MFLAPGDGGSAPKRGRRVVAAGVQQLVAAPDGLLPAVDRMAIAVMSASI